MWAETAFRRIEFGTPTGEIVNDHEESWTRLYQGLSEAYGRSPLVTLREMNRRVQSQADFGPERQLGAHLMICADIEVMDFIAGVFQVSASMLEASSRRSTFRRVGAGDEAEELGALINRIFEEEGVGYRWLAGQIVRFDEPVTHDLAIEPAVELLRDGQFGEANDEFSAALDAYRDGRWRDAITNANAAFESVLKVRTGKSGLTAGPLIRAAREQGVIPKYLGGAVENLEKLMHAAPATRGAEAAHGQGDRPSEADQHLAQLIVSVVASFILFVGRPLQ